METMSTSARGYSVLDHASYRGAVEAFIYLQLLDVMSTLIGFSLGDPEASPFIRLLIQFGPLVGLVLSKLIALACVAVCILIRRPRLIRWINYWYAALVVWNLYVALRVLHL